MDFRRRRENLTIIRFAQSMNLLVSPFFFPASGVIYKSNLWIYGFRERSEREAYFPACGVIYKSNLWIYGFRERSEQEI